MANNIIINDISINNGLNREITSLGAVDRISLTIKLINPSIKKP